MTQQGKQALQGQERIMEEEMLLDTHILVL